MKVNQRSAIYYPCPKFDFIMVKGLSLIRKDFTVIQVIHYIIFLSKTHLLSLWSKLLLAILVSTIFGPLGLVLGPSKSFIVIAFGFKQLFEVRFTIKFALKCSIVSKSTSGKKTDIKFWQQWLEHFRLQNNNNSYIYNRQVASFLQLYIAG